MGVTAKVVRRTRVSLPKEIKGPTKVKVGFPAGEQDNHVLMKAIWNNFGTEESVTLIDGSGSQAVIIPERPFISNSIDANKIKYRKALRKAARKILLGTETAENTLQKLGVLAQGDMQMEIVNLNDPSNAQSTIDKKGSSNPLIDTGEMKNAVTFITYD